MLSVESADDFEWRYKNVPLHYICVLMLTGDFLVLHLSELVRMAFIAATSDCDRLRLAGLAALQVRMRCTLTTRWL